MSDQPADPRRILAMGGGGFTMQERSPALDRLVLTLTGKPVPKICFLPTASGDPREQATRFYERFTSWPCEPSILSLFHLARDRINPREHLLAQDAIYVGGGSMRNMLAVWREHGVDQAMVRAWESGVVLAGLSAGAMCWFRGGITMSGGAPAAAAGLGLLDGSMSVHLDSEPERLTVYRQAVSAGLLDSGYAADDGAALLFAGTRLQGCVGSRPGSRVLRVLRVRGEGDGLGHGVGDSDGHGVGDSDGHGHGEGADAGATSEHELHVKLLPGAQAPGTDAGEPRGVSELRALRAGRHRWD